MVDKIKDWMKPLVPYLNKKGYFEEEEIYRVCSNALVYRITEEIVKIASNVSKGKEFSLEDNLELGKYDDILNMDRLLKKGDSLTTNNIAGEIIINYKDKQDKNYIPLLAYDVFSAGGVFFKVQEVKDKKKEIQESLIENLINKISKNNFFVSEDAKKTLDTALSQEILRLDNSSKIINLICDNFEYNSAEDSRYVKRKIKEFPKLQKKVNNLVNSFNDKLQEPKARGSRRIKSSEYMQNFIEYLEKKGSDPEEEVRGVLDKLFKKQNTSKNQ